MDVRTHSQSTSEQVGNPHTWIFTLRPYGSSMSSPAVTFWIRSAWIVIFFMSLVEATIWGLVGNSLAPGDSFTLNILVSIFAFSLIFLLIWIVDSSFIMAEKPIQKRISSKADGKELNLDTDSPWRWRLGIVVRMSIVLISLFITAPLLTLVIRSDEIAVLFDEKQAEYKEKVEQRGIVEVDRRKRQATEHIDIELDPLLEKKINLDQEINRLQEMIDDPDGPYKAEIGRVQKAIDALMIELTAEEEGTNGSRPGRGPKYEALITELVLLNKEKRVMGSKNRTEAKASDKSLRVLLKQYEAKRAKLTPLIDELKNRKIALLAELSNELENNPVEESGLNLTLGMQWTLLDEILSNERELKQKFRTDQPLSSENPDDGKSTAIANGASTDLKIHDNTQMPWSEIVKKFFIQPWSQNASEHARSVDGLAQAILLMLFLALLALKLFEPKSVRHYFSEKLQLKWSDYLRGAFDRTPGFTPGSDPALRMNHLDFARTYLEYDLDHNAFYDGFSEKLRKEHEASEVKHQAVLAQTITEAILSNEIETMSKRFEEHEKQREISAKAWHKKNKLKMEQDKNRFNAEMDALKEKSDRETKWRDKKAAQLYAQREEMAQQRTKAWEQEMESIKQDIELKRKELIEQDQLQEARLKEIDNSHKLEVVRLEMENSRKRFEARHNIIKTHLADWMKHKQDYQEQLNSLQDELQEIENQGLVIKDNRATLRDRVTATKAEITDLKKQEETLLLMLDRTDPDDTKRIDQLADRKSAKREQIDNRREQLTTFGEENRMLKIEQKENQKRWELIESEIDSIDEEIHHCDDKLHSLQNQQDDLVGENAAREVA